MVDSQMALVYSIFENLTSATLLSLIATGASFGIYLCGTSICQQIMRNGTTDGISIMPFLMCCIGSLLWVRYGFLKGDSAISTVSGFGFILEMIYLVIYYRYHPNKRSLARRLAGITIACILFLLYVQHYATIVPELVLAQVGFVSVIFNVLTLGAPLAAVKDVVRLQSSENLPFSLCLANLASSTMWFLYAYVVNDTYVKIPNAIGIILGLVQVSLLVWYPSRTPLSLPKSVVAE